MDMVQPFELTTEYTPAGDQPNAIKELMEGLKAGDSHQVLLGATGTGKTFTIANVIEELQRPTLVMAPNKTLAAQLYSEFKDLFGANSVEYFVSYYDYYQPEAYIPSTDTFIEKDSTINDAIDRMRHSATRSLFERNDVIIVASVSCIYGLGTSEAYAKMLIQLERGMEMQRKELLKKLVDIQYERKHADFHRGTFRVRGDIVEIFPTYEEDTAVRVEFFGDEIEELWEIDPLRGKKVRPIDKIAVYPNTHYAVLPERRKIAIDMIKEELKERLEYFVSAGKLLEAQRLEQRTQFDLEMMITMGYCNGIENYSRMLSGRGPGDPPPTLLDYFPKGFLTVVDESHVTIPQIGGMFRGDRSRKEVLVEHGFRLPSAMDNRPLTFDEWCERTGQIIHVSATPGDWELDRTQGVIVEQIIRPTGLIDPYVEVRPALDQVDDVYGEIRKRVEKNERVLVTTLTKRMSEDLTEYLQELGIRVRYLHSEIDTIERMNIVRDLRIGVFDVLIGINLLREGLDIPEVSLVGILDADKEGFLRSARSLIQTIGRAARNVNGTVILYADDMTDSIEEALSETNRRRAIQLAYNDEHGITPATVKKKISDLEQHVPEEVSQADAEIAAIADKPLEDYDELIGELRAKMQAASSDLRFEEAAKYRDEIRRMEQAKLGIS